MFVRLLNTLFYLSFNFVKPNIIQNGDFEVGDVDPWKCIACQCDASNNYLAVTERKETWSGPRQKISPNNFVQEPLMFQLNFSLQVLDPCTANVILHVVHGEEEKFMSIWNEDVTDVTWTDYAAGVIVNNIVIDADNIELYFETKPQTANFNIDNVYFDLLEPDMSWKEEANDRIEQLRKRNVIFNFMDTDASKLVLDVVQTSHSFPFGQAVNSEHIAGCRISDKDDEVCDFVKQNFNWVVDTFRMKWNAIEPHRGDFKTVYPDQMIFWAQENNISVRGHSLLWHKSQPQWSLELFGQNFTDAMFEYLDKSLDHFDSLGVKMWDVINEMVDQGGDGHNMYIDQSLDPQIRAKIYKHVKERYPDTIFFINDYGIILDKHNRFNLYRELIRDLLSAGAPIDAIGNDFLDWITIKEKLDLLWEEFHLPIWATEFDWNWRNSVNFGDHSYHAEVIDNFYRLMFSHQSIHGILSWTLNTLDDNSIPNKAGEAYINLYHEEWRTNQIITPTEASSVKFRGFRGNYEVVMKRNDIILGQVDFNLDENLTFDCVEDIILGKIECFMQEDQDFHK